MGPLSEDVPTGFVTGGAGLRLAVYESTLLPLRMVLVHGVGGGGRLYSEFSRHLEEVGIGAIAYDLRGHGNSEAPLDPHTMTDPTMLAEDLKGVIARCDPDGAVTVLAWSLGATVLSCYLSLYGAEGLEKVILVAPALSIGDERAQRYTGPEFASAVRAYLSSTRSSDPNTCDDFAREVVGTQAPPGYLRLAADLASRLPLELRREIFSQKADFANPFVTLTVPVTVVHGSRDRVILEGSSIEFAAGVPSVELRLLANSEHSPFMDDYVGTLKAMGISLRE